MKQIERAPAVLGQEAGEHSHPSQTTPGVVDHGVPKGISRRVGLLSGDKHMNVMDPGQAFDQPDQARDHPVFASRVHAAGNDDGDLHAPPVRTA
jgi:hypothetical protein